MSPSASSRRSLLATGLAYGAVGTLGCNCPLAGQSIVLSAPLRTVRVSNSTQLVDALNDAQPGDHIVLANGIFSRSQSVSLNGTQANPIVIRAEKKHGAIITADWTVTGNDITIYELKFQGGTGKVGRVDGGLRYRFLRNLCDGPSGRWEFHNAANDVEIAYNTFQNGSGDRLIDFRMSGGSSGSAKRPWIHHNYFHNNKNGNNIAIGTNKTHSHFSVDGIIEWNLAKNIDGNLVYIKTSNNIIRNNTRTNNSAFPAKSTVNIRHGRNCRVVANVAIGESAGVIIRGDRHMVIGNYSDTEVPHSRWNSHIAATGDVIEDEFPTTGGRPRADECKFIGNIGNLWVGGDDLSNTLPARNTLVRAHSGGTITIDTTMLAGGGGPRSVGTIDQRDHPPGIDVPPYVILAEADVGPDAD